METIFTPTTLEPTVRYGFNLNFGKPMFFKDKKGNSHLIYLDSKQTLSSRYYLVIVKTNFIVFNNSYIINGDRIGYLFVSKSEDGVFRSENTLTDAFFVKEEFRKNGIGTAMHDYLNNVHSIITKPSRNAISQDAINFWEKYKIQLKINKNVLHTNI